MIKIFLPFRVVCLFVFLVTSHTVSAQCNTIKQEQATISAKTQIPNAVPFDGGASALLIAGTVYGIRRLYKKEKK